MAYFSKEEFEDGLKKAAQFQPDLRRLKFQCPDNSQGFTVYFTAIGILGVPDKNVICKDGFALLTYGPGYVREIEE